MGASGLRRPFNHLAKSFFVPASVGLIVALLPMNAAALGYPWVLLVPQNDSRDPEVCAEDEAQSLYMVAVMNQRETLFHHQLTWKKVAIKDLLSMNVPFCELHFDAIKPFSFSPDEKIILSEYLKRGGFILFYIDAYPYSQDEFWKVKQWPLIDFLTKELPVSDPNFTVGKATDSFPLFNVHYRTSTADPIRHELAGNLNTPNRTLIFHQQRLCCFVMGQYNYLDGDEWVARTRPFSHEFSPLLKSYQLVVNIYTYSIVQ